MHVISTFLQFPTFEPFEFWYSNTCIVFKEFINLIMHRLSKFDIIDRVILFVVFVLATPVLSEIKFTYTGTKNYAEWFTMI